MIIIYVQEESIYLSFTISNYKVNSIIQSIPSLKYVFDKGHKHATETPATVKVDH